MARSPKTTKKPLVENEYEVTLEVLIPAQQTFIVSATSPAEAIQKALDEDWDDPEYAFGSEASDTYCVELQQEEKGHWKTVSIPKKYQPPKE